MNLHFDSNIVNLLLKTNVETEDLMFLFWSALIVGERVMRFKR